MNIDLLFNINSLIIGILSVCISLNLVRIKKINEKKESRILLLIIGFILILFSVYKLI